MIILFLWTPKGVLSPELFLNFPPRLQKSFKFILLRLLQINFWVKKLNLSNFTHAPKQTFPPGLDHYPPRRPELPIPPEEHFQKILPFLFAFFDTTFFPEQKEGERVITKIGKCIGHKFWQLPPSLLHLHFWFKFCCAII